MMEWRKLNSLTLSIVAALCLTAAWTWSWLALLILPGFILSIEVAKRSNKPLGFLYLIFALWNGATTYWIANAHPLGLFATVVVNGGLMAFALWFGVRSSAVLSRSKSLRRIEYLPVIACWMAFEHLHESWGLAFPWLNLGNTFHGLPHWVQWYSWTGAVGGTLWVLLMALLWSSERSSMFLKSGVVLLPILLSLGLWSLPESVSEESITVHVVQPNIDAYSEKWDLPERVQIEKVERLLSEANRPKTDLIVLPETFLPKARAEGQLGQSVADRNLLRVMRKYGAVSVFGATTYDFQYESNVYNRPYGDRFYTLYNSAVFVKEDQTSLEIYHKGKLVQGAEKMPFVRYLKPLLGDWAIELGGTTGTLGVSDHRKVFEADSIGLKLAPVICWENEFSDYATGYARVGANLISVITNDGWWGNTPGHVQHLNFSGLRAIEQNKYVVRSANTGISAIISSKGKILQQLDWDMEGVITAEVPLIEGQTFYVRTGNILGPIMTIIFFANVFVILISRFFRLKPR